MSMYPEQTLNAPIGAVVVVFLIVLFVYLIMKQDRDKDE